jgi:cytochrome c biogenesis protein CcmG, thiol:disulfide interchange protein DsbE
MGLLATALTALVLAGCGSSGSGDYGGKHPDYGRALAGSPAPLAALHSQANQLLSGGSDAYDKRIAALKGYPIVANVWASWCGPCRFEFPFFQKQVTKRGKQVAFVGVEGEDSRDGGRRFLAKFPIPYPSFFDPHSDIAQVFHGDRSFPTTVFYDRTGGVEYVKQGGYASEAALARDITRYAR